MSDIWKKARPGQRLEIPAATFNAWVDAARAERNRQHDLSQDPAVESRQTTIVKVQNASGADQDRFAVLTLSDPIITAADNVQEFKNRPNFTGVAPVDPTKCKTWCVLLEPLKDGAIGRAILAGVTPVKINVIREDDRFADIEVGTTGNLRSVPFGTARILWKESGAGTKWAVVRLGDRPRFAIFQLAGTWEPAAEASSWMKMTGCKPVFFSTGTSNYAVDNSEPTETVWHVTGYPGIARTAMKAAHAADGVAPVKYGCGDWVWCHWNDQDCRWQVLGDYEDIWRFELTGELKCNGVANAQVVVNDQLISLNIQVYDSLKLTALLPGQKAESRVRGAAKYWADSCRWEVIAIGGKCPSSSSSSSSPSSSPPSSSPSSSPPSSSPSSSPPPSSSPSSSPPPVCDYTGSITLGSGVLYRSGNNVCQSLVTLVFRQGQLCSIASAGTSCADVCNCGSSSSPSPPSSSPSSSPPSSSPSSSPPSPSPSPSSSPSSSPPPSSSPSSPVCGGQCAWVGEDDSSQQSSPSSSSGGSYTCGGTCFYMWDPLGMGGGWELWDGTQCNPTEGNPSGICYCSPPNYSGSYAGEIGYGTCGDQPPSPASSGDPACWGECDYYWSTAMSPAQWVLSHTTCQPGVSPVPGGRFCECRPPLWGGSYHGEVSVGTCEAN